MGQNARHSTPGLSTRGFPVLTPVTGGVNFCPGGVSFCSPAGFRGMPGTGGRELGVGLKEAWSGSWRGSIKDESKSRANRPIRPEK